MDIPALEHPSKSMKQNRYRQVPPFVRIGVLTCLISCVAPCMLLQAEAQDKPPAQAPATPAGQNKPAAPTTGTAGGAGGAGGAAVSSSDYKVGPSDVLFIRVWGEPEFSGPVSVHQDGKFTLQLVGDLQAGGKTPIEIQDIVADALKKMVVKPLVTVTVQEVGSKKYYLVGQVARTGEYPLVQPTTILEALDKSGGLGDFANAKHIYVLRGSKRIPFNYKEVIKGKNMAQNILIEPGDHIVVP
jgi:polysaccharide biosynthesis/export protein